MEHRWGHRQTAHQPVRLLTVGGVAGYGYILNVSVSGAFVQTPLPARTLSLLHITFVSQNRRFCAIRKASAQVVRKTADGLGLEWCEQMPEIVALVASLSIQDQPTRYQPSPSRRYTNS
jgi:hypothetical protein